MTGLFDGDLSSPCYKDRRRILCRLFRAPWWFRPRHLTPHPRLILPVRNDIILALHAGLRLLIREYHLLISHANLHVEGRSHVRHTWAPIVAGQFACEKR